MREPLRRLLVRAEPLVLARGGEVGFDGFLEPPGPLEVEGRDAGIGDVHRDDRQQVSDRAVP